MSKQTTLLISYVPLLDYSKHDIGTLLKATELGQLDDEIQNVHFSGCIWAGEDDKFTPILITDNVKQIVDHFTAWAEGHPPDWFDLVIEDNGDRYMVALVPRVQQSIKRWEVARLLRTGKQPEPLTDCKIFFKLLAFGSSVSPTFHMAKHKLSGELGFIDSKDFSFENPFNIDSEKVITCGPFERADPVMHASLIDSYLAGIESSDRPSMVNPDLQ